MATKKITELNALSATPDNADILAIVDNPSGSAETKKITVSNLLGDAVTVSSGAVDLGGNTLLNFDASVNEQTGTSYTLQASDLGKIVKLTHGSAITVTLPNNLGLGFTCTVIQYGAGQITFSTSSSTLYNRQSHTKTAGQYAVVSLISCVADVFVLAGDTAS
tara:strand:- start:1316 stop:1804 length:489 start_codon:yes stop_codon:yes gene_type:complete